LGLIEGDFAESQGPDTSTQDSAVDHFFDSFEKRSSQNLMGIAIPHSLA